MLPTSRSSPTVCAPITPQWQGTTIIVRLQLRVDRFFLPQELRRDRLGSRLLKLAEEEGRRRRCTRVTLNTMEIQAPGFYLKQGYEMAAKLDCDPPGITRYVMTKRLLP